MGPSSVRKNLLGSKSIEEKMESVELEQKGIMSAYLSLPPWCREVVSKLGTHWNRRFETVIVNFRNLEHLMPLKGSF